VRKSFYGKSIRLASGQAAIAGLKTNPSGLTFGEYWEKWIETMKAGMSVNQIRDYTKIVNYYLLPYFGDMAFSEFKLMTMKKFLAHLSGMENRYGRTLSSSTINNIFIPLRTLTADAFTEYEFVMPDPFAGLKMPLRKRIRVNPLTMDEWNRLMDVVNPWYVPYFEFAVTTGVRPSEQVALKWKAIDGEYIEIELSRVKGYEKEDLKTENSRRSIEIRPLIREILDRQKTLTKHLRSEYVFVNMDGRPINQDKMRQLWERIEKKAGIPHRRMYEIRHTFASWALAAGEQPGWVAKTLGHADLTMVYSVYARYIPDLKKDDGGKFETLYAKKHLS
jgi:integrase